MMSDLNILDFYKDAALTLTNLHRAFPRPIDLFVEDLIGAQSLDEFGLPSKRHSACLSTMLWLCDEGFIRFSNVNRHDGIDQAVLTHHAFVELAGHSTDIGQESMPPTMAQQIQTALNSQSSEQISSVMAFFFKKSLSLHDR